VEKASGRVMIENSGVVVVRKKEGGKEEEKGSQRTPSIN
jgi:hypothetical protein